MERYDASEGEEEVRLSAASQTERSGLLGRGAGSSNKKKKNKGKYDSGLGELDTDFDEDNEQVVFSVGETKRPSGKDGAFDNHYSQITPKSYQFKALFRKNFKLQLRQRCTLCCQIVVPLLLILYVGAMQLLFNSLLDDNKGWKDPEVKMPVALNQSWTYFIGDPLPQSVPDLGYLSITGDKGGMLSSINQTKYFTPNGTAYHMPFLLPYSSRAKLQTEIKSMKDRFSAALQSGGEIESFLAAPFAALAFSFRNVSTQGTPHLSFELQREQQYPYIIAYQGDSSSELGVAGIILMASAWLVASINLVVKTLLQGFPYEDLPLNIDVGSFTATLTYPLIMSWLLPVYVYNIVLEKQEKLREMMKMMGLKMINYWIVTFLYNAILYLAVLVIVYCFSYGFGFAIFTQGSVPATLFLFLLWGNAQIAVAFFLSSIFNSTRFATIFCYFLVIIQAILSFVINATVFKDDNAPFFWNLWPPFAFFRAIYVLGAQCGRGECPETSDYDFSNEIVHIFLFLIFTSFFFYLLAFYLDAVLPKQFGVSKKPWFFLTPIIKLFRRSAGSSAVGRSVQADEENLALLEPKRSVTQTVEALEEPDDVARERQKVYDAQIDADCPVIIRDLRKEYGARFGKSKKVAVQNLTLSMQKGECFGLLGPNGAGKTTTLSILTGLFPPSSGTAHIGGFDIRTDIDKVHRVMGVCPQFDTLWLDLTCEETLLFYARLKGVAGKDESEHTMQSLNMVGLQDFPKRLVKDLSGGMRRRLSVAVSLVGNPRIVFLDEPTTGLDPESRRHLWDVLAQVKTDRCMILTTHSMEEADVLCTTIGIMSNGCLRCVGPQQDLKTRFGQGYTLTLNYPPEAENQVTAFVRELLPSASLVEKFAGNATYQIPSTNLVISELFEVMEEKKDEAGITDWGISQTSLEDVFLTIVRNDEGGIGFTS